MQIPFVNLTRQTEQLRPDYEAIFSEILSQNTFIGGSYLINFETNFSKIVDERPVVGNANGTTALFVALKTLGIEKGDEVITTPHTFAATIEAILQIGAIPKLIDIRSDDYTIDVSQIEAAITNKTRALLPVHIYGTVCEMNQINKLAETYNLKVIEDAAQAHLATYENRPAGSLGDAAAFSFYPGKNLGALGDAGATVFASADWATTARKLVNHGRADKYLHDVVGYNFRMDTLQAALLNRKLMELTSWTENRRTIAAYYDNRLKKAGFKVIETTPAGNPAYHLYIVEVSNRENVVIHMQNKGVDTGIHYPVPMHKQPAFQNYFQATQYPVCDSVVDRIISLPICGCISLEEAEYVVNQFVNVAKA